MSGKVVKNMVVDEYLREYKKTPSLTLAKKIYKDNPALFTSIETCRCAVRYRRGASGERDREKAKKKYAEFFRPISFNNTNPFNLPEPEVDDYVPYALPTTCTNILHIQDFHIPYHCNKTIGLALEYGRNKDVNTVLFGYDFMDMYSMSRFIKDPRKRNFSYERDTAIKVIEAMKRALPKAKFFFRTGNHDDRYEQYMHVKAPELLDCKEFELKNILRLHDYDITCLAPKQIVKAGKLNIIHGNEYGGANSSSVNPARGIFIRALNNTMVGHSHRSSEHIESDINGNIFGTVSLGCACQLHPEYARLNKWNNGFAHILVNKDKSYHVNNMKVIGYKIV